MSTNAREVALEVLTACRKADAWADGALKSALSRAGLDSRDAAFAARLTYGVVQNRMLLDFRIGKYCKTGIRDLEPVILDILRIGACQILLMDRVPPSAAVNQAVEMAKGHHRTRAAGLVNAILRNLIREKDTLPPVTDLSIQYSHPQWLVDTYITLLGREEAERTLAENNRPVPMTIQRNPLRVSRDDLEAELPAAQPHRTIFFERPMKAGETIEVEFSYTIRADYVRPDSSKVLNEQPTFYTEEQLPHIALTPYIRAVAAEITGGDKNPLIRARRIYDYITSHLMYSFVRPYMAITDIPGYAASGWKGDCGIQALLFVTLCRAADIPARWQSGLYTTPVNVGCHDWAQFYVEPYGWLFADCSFGGSAWRAGSTLRHDFYFGNLEPFRMPAASDFQQEFSPARKFPRNDPYDNQVGEAEYADRPMEAGEFELKTELLKAEEL